MTAMAPLLASGGPWFVAAFRLLPAGVVLMAWAVVSGRRWSLDRRDLAWFLLFTLVDACLFQGLLACGLAQTGAGLGSVLIDSQPLLVALLARVLFAESINPVGWLGLALGLAGIVCLGVPQICWVIGGCCWTHPNFCSCFNPVRDGCCWPLWRWRWAPY